MTVVQRPADGAAKGVGSYASGELSKQPMSSDTESRGDMSGGTLPDHELHVPHHTCRSRWGQVSSP